MRRLAAVLAGVLSLALLGVHPVAAAPPTAQDPWDRTAQPPTALRDGTPRQAGLVGEHLAAIEPALRAGLEPQPVHPAFPGAVALVARKGVVALHTAVGDALRWADPDTELPPAERLPMRHDTIFDLASISKLFTAVAVLQLVERGELALDDPVAAHLPAFGAAGKGGITVEQLLIHTSGLPAWLNLYAADEPREARIQRIYDTAPTAAPGTRYTYSDLGLIVLGELVEAVSGQPLDVLVRERITAPLGMRDTGYNPDPSLRERIAATEDQPWTGRGLVHGEVHDENAWALGGVAGHAGVFSTARDLAVFGQMLLNGGRYGTAEILEPATVQAMMTDRTLGLSTTSRGLGPELAARFYHDAMTSPHSAGHTGFTGTSLVLDPHTDAIAILLTNRVHPSREWAPVNPARRAVARATARAVPVHPLQQGAAWFSGLGDDLDRSLTVPVDAPAGSRLELGLWFDTDPADAALIEASSDGGRTWQRLAGVLRSSGTADRATDGRLSGWGERRWWDATFPLEDLTGPVLVRVRYRTDGLYSGRGVYVDRIRVVGPTGPVFDDRRPADAARIDAGGWVRSAD